MRILVIGGNGMLGHTVATVFKATPGLDVHIAVRSASSCASLTFDSDHIHAGIDATSFSELESLLTLLKPDYVVNCIGVTKQKLDKKAIINTLEINAIFPQKLALLCQELAIKMIHISTDCVFSGKTGMYTEDSEDFAHDLYGVSKRFGEVEGEGILTIRTSIIGHELSSFKSLIDWFLAQEGEIKGFSKAIFSGFPTVTLAKIIREYLLGAYDIQGLYHVSAEPIDKFTLLKLVAEVYGKDIIIHEDQSLVLDRSLDSTRFREVTGYKPPTWQKLIEEMHEHYSASNWYIRP